MAVAKATDVHISDKDKTDVWMDLEDLEGHHGSASSGIHSGTMFETLNHSLFSRNQSHHHDTVDERMASDTSSQPQMLSKDTQATGLPSILHLDSLPNSQNASQSAPVSPHHSSFAGGGLTGLPMPSVDLGLSASSGAKTQAASNSFSAASGQQPTQIFPPTSANLSSPSFVGPTPDQLPSISSTNSNYSMYSGFSSSTASGGSHTSNGSNYSFASSFSQQSTAGPFGANGTNSVPSGYVANAASHFLQQPPVSFHPLHKSTSHPVGLSMSNHYGNHLGGGGFFSRDRDSEFGSSSYGFDQDRRSSSTTSSSLNSPTPGGYRNSWGSASWSHEDGLASPSASMRGLALEDGADPNQASPAIGPEEDVDDDEISDERGAFGAMSVRGSDNEEFSASVHVGRASLRALGRSVSHDSNLSAFLRGDGLLLGSPIKREHSREDVSLAANLNNAWGMAALAANSGAAPGGVGGTPVGVGSQSEGSSLQSSPTPKDNGSAPQKRSGLRPNGGAGVFAAAAAAAANAGGVIPGGMVPPSPKAATSRKQKKTTSIRRSRDITLKKVGGFEVTSRIAPVSAIEIDNAPPDGAMPKKGNNTGLPRIVSGGGRLQRRRKGTGVSPAKASKRSGRYDADFETDVRPGMERKRSKSLEGELDWRSPGGVPGTGVDGEPKISVVVAQIVEAGAGASSQGSGVVIARSMTDSDLSSHLKEKGRKGKSTRKKTGKSTAKPKKGKSRKKGGDDGPTTATIAPMAASRGPVMAGVVVTGPGSSATAGNSASVASSAGSNAMTPMTSGMGSMMNSMAPMNSAGVRAVGQGMYGSSAYNYYGNSMMMNNMMPPSGSMQSNTISRTKSMDNVNMHLNVNMYNNGGYRGAGGSSPGGGTDSVYITNSSAQQTSAAVRRRTASNHGAWPSQATEGHSAYGYGYDMNGNVYLTPSVPYDASMLSHASSGYAMTAASPRMQISSPSPDVSTASPTPVLHGSNASHVYDASMFEANKTDPPL